MEKIVLNGITWNHSRGFTPLVAAAQRFAELHPHVEINWKKRTLQEFADFSIEKLAATYDLLIIDHPWAGFAAQTGVLLPLDNYVNAELLQDLEQNTIGETYASYWFNKHIWALPVDAATPVASYRADLLEANGVALPQTWDDVLELAGKGLVAAPGIEVDVLMNFYMFCLSLGETPFLEKDELIDHATGVEALLQMRAFYSLLNKKFFSCNPIAVAEIMSTTNQYVYCPFAYGYSNYARDGYAKYRVSFTDIVSKNGELLRSTLGGTGLAISAKTQHASIAAAFASFLCSSQHQSLLYMQHGGQPAHKKAWTHPICNRLTHNYFSDTLPALERAFLRPRYNGYLQFQDDAGKPLQEYLLYGGDATQVLNTMNRMYRQSQPNYSKNKEAYV